MRAKKLLFMIMSTAWIFLTGCTVSIAATVNPNGSGEVKFIYKLSKDDQSFLSQGGQGGDASKLCEGMATMSESFPGQGSIKQEKHGSETWCVMSQAFGRLEEMRTNLDQQGLSINSLSIANGRFVFDASMNTSGSSGESNGALPVGFTFELTLPGRVISHNADKVESYTLIWEMGIGQVKQMHAESGVEGRRMDWIEMIQKPVVILPCIGIIILALVVLIVGEITRGSRPRKLKAAPPSGPSVTEGL